MEITIKWNLCRVCLQEQQNSTQPMKLIFEDTRLPKDIFECAGIEMNLNDGLPEKICSKCILMLKYALRFRNTCRESDSYLRNVILKTKSTTKLFSNSEQNADRNDIDNFDLIEEEIDINEDYTENLENATNSERHANDSLKYEIHDISSETTHVKTENTTINFVNSKNDDMQNSNIYLEGTDTPSTYNVEIVDDSSPPKKKYELIARKKILRVPDIKRENEILSDGDGDGSSGEDGGDTLDLIDRSDEITEQDEYIEIPIQENYKEHYLYDLEDDQNSDSGADKNDKISKSNYYSKIDVDDNYSESGSIESNTKETKTVSAEPRVVTRDLFVCEVCGNHFPNRNLLACHSRLHQKNKKFECEYVLNNVI